MNRLAGALTPKLLQRTVASAAMIMAVMALVFLTVEPASAARIRVLNLDSPTEGFNDKTPVDPVGGNEGTNIGAQRLIAAQYAAEIWGEILQSPVEILVAMTFDPLFCSANGAVLGQAAPNCMHLNFDGAPERDTLYTAALANSLFGADLCPPNSGCQCPSADMFAQFNSELGTGCQFATPWYYGLDGAASEHEIDFVTVLLHEIGHGLGFLSTENPFSGEFYGGVVDTYSANLFDETEQAAWPDLTAEERFFSGLNDQNLSWLGSRVTEAAPKLHTSGLHAVSGRALLYAPTSLQGGSSISHFDVSLSPNSLMEPSYTGVLHWPGLAIPLMEDIGWKLGSTARCGNGVIDPGEVCDDGNRLDGDCCAADCSPEPNGLKCEDGDENICTSGKCDGFGVCIRFSNHDPCDDGNFCNGADTCSNGSCSESTGDPCEDGPPCQDVCDETTDSCLAPNGDSCTDDMNECTLDACDGRGNCRHVKYAVEHQHPCDDGVFCNGPDICSDGACSVHSGDPCVGGAECADSCDEALDTCNVEAGESCGGQAGPCDQEECDGSGSCVSVDVAVLCGDGNPCTTDTCSPTTGCSNTPIPACTATTTTTLGGPRAVCGDASGDGQILAGDALMALRAAVDLEFCDLAQCDVDGSGVITAHDAQMVLARTVDSQITLSCVPRSSPSTTLGGLTSTTTLP